MRRPQLDARLDAVVPENPHGVTDKDGVVKIENVPAGKQKVEVWHPMLGKQTKEVEVKAGQDDQGRVRDEGASSGASSGRPPESGARARPRP